MGTYIPETFTVTMTSNAYVTVGALLTLMNIIVRPLLSLLTLPLRLFATLFAVVLVQLVFLKLTLFIVNRMDPEVVTLTIQNGFAGWILVALIVGMGNWLMKILIR